ncbi:hypothetical protein HX787_03525 [Pseudomonas tolaasii]|uniref:Uncharacterized protein n=1 Tax=Pseudomonas tolaasii TaxID=29442 RepID=A0A7Y8AM11_PSETO|nr:hypothetical protein [Pseudomonas tolaasii]ARB28299.1 hypothetical protein B5P22_13740 [Pseudomonas tolaasii]KAB0477033.1 hypothetical protein F7R12_06280 [Pseudomonas tolaasii]MBY8938740.1 hypothetical protein [Pseudomonas tolaasii]NVZ47171.1 hypothetical protein [Pseudomonas tolaasii]NWA51367.1 hypothetical protein [Pseudomonas tolaasii]
MEVSYKAAGIVRDLMIVPTLSVGMPYWTLRVRSWDAERPWLHSHAERGNEIAVQKNAAGHKPAAFF